MEHGSDAAPLLLFMQPFDLNLLSPFLSHWSPSQVQWHVSSTLPSLGLPPRSSGEAQWCVAWLGACAMCVKRGT